MKECLFQLIRYVPDVIRNEFVNIGVVLFEVNTETPEVIVRLTKDWSRVLCLDPDADIEMLGELEKDLEKTLRDSAPNILEKARYIKSQWSAGLQLEDGIDMTAAKGILVEDLTRETDRLMKMYVVSASTDCLESPSNGNRGTADIDS